MLQIRKGQGVAIHRFILSLSRITTIVTLNHHQVITPASGIHSHPIQGVTLNHQGATHGVIQHRAGHRIQGAIPPLQGQVVAEHIPVHPGRQVVPSVPLQDQVAVVALGPQDHPPVAQEVVADNIARTQ